ncbi:MAG TPA: hypothetical protein VK308_16610 [Pyrinomonadaceae bacterium]|nr:hypothetical protein [Pyrinomonadaceae bacterium]
MKIKFLAILGLAAVAGFAGCKGDTANTNTNTAVVTNTTNTNMTMATPMSTPAATKDSAAETAVKAALDKAGMKDVMVDATTSEITLRGTVAKGKMSEAVRIATETGKRKVNNQIVEK